MKPHGQTPIGIRAFLSSEPRLAPLDPCLAAPASYNQAMPLRSDEINLQAFEIMERIHDALKAGGCNRHALERFLMRVLFCLFAEDTGIFKRESFRLYLEYCTAENGSDFSHNLSRLFDVLSTAPEKRPMNLDETLATFPCINGELFVEPLGFADFTSDMRGAVLAATRFDWSQISPAVFGSLFQTVMEPKNRRQMGAHYTSERDIIKVVRALFLDDLRAEFQRIKENKNELKRFHQKLGKLRFMDPACGCGNFLIIAYRELRLLEIEVLKALNRGAQIELDIQHLSRVDVDAFYGIEIGEWPARIAEAAMWLVDHQMNLRLSEALGQYIAPWPLRKSTTIICGNALRLDWKQILPPAQCSYILSNPPFVGKHLMTPEQGADMALIWGKTGGVGLLDYVTAWHHKAAEYIQGTRAIVGFVSTSSISQGEQVGALWNPLFQRFGLKIHFAHRTFSWESNVTGKAHVHVVIIGFAAFDADVKRLFEYDAEGQDTTMSVVKNISPYLIEGSDTAISSRSTPLCDVPACEYGNKPTDGGFLIIEENERKQFLADNPGAKKFLRPLICAEEYLHNIPRWCLWLVDATPEEIREIPGIKARVDAVRAFRSKSKKAPTQKKAGEPALFAEIRQPASRYLIIPQHTSEGRNYVPLGYYEPSVIVHNSCSAVPGATLCHFGVLSSKIHMAWVKQVCGRLESRYRYSSKIVYNNYPWPQNTSATQTASVEAAAQTVLHARALYKDATLAQLYDPASMPSKLLKAHVALDRAVDRCYRAKAFASERERVEFLFAIYEQLTAQVVVGMIK